MNGELAASMAVVMHGNAWLTNPSAEPPSLERHNTTFRYVNTLTFVEPKQGLFRRGTSYDGTAGWLRAVHEGGVERLALFSPDTSSGNLTPAVASSFANGVPRGVVTIGPTPVLWSSSWDTSGAEHPRGEIWQVTMTSHALRPVPLAPPLPVPKARSALMEALGSVRSFAAANELEDWERWFSKALAVADSPDPEVPYNPDIAPNGWLTLDQQQLLAAAVQAFVFGGMGSWNDIWLADESQSDRYVALTDDLYAAVTAAIVAVVNAP